MAAGKHRLTDTSIRNAKPVGSRRRLSDGDGLFLIVTAASKRWQYDYQIEGKRRSLSLGIYPLVSLARARQDHEQARRWLKVEGIDPVVARAANRADRKKTKARESLNTLKLVSERWLAKQQTWAESHRSKVELRLKNDVYPMIGDRPIASITTREIGDCLRLVENRGAIDSAHRIKQTLGQIFRFAIQDGLLDYDPTLALKGALTKYERGQYPHITDPKRLGQVLKAIDGYEGSAEVRAALRLLPLVFVRPGELRNAEWVEFDLERSTWTIPATRMKRSKNGNHIVPLSTQAKAIIEELYLLTGTGELLFPGARSSKRPISDNSLNAALRTLDVSKDEHVAHGFRHTASTLLNEQRGVDPDLIEVQLHHMDKSVRGKYNGAKYISARREMMQGWSDFLHSLKS